MAGPYPESDLLPISALQHLLFCERQCALIHLEGLWAENLFTAEGRHMHDKVDQAGTETRGEVHIGRGLPLHCFRLGLVGKADVVEFHADENGVSLGGIAGKWRPFPVEYKRGRPKRDRSDEVQLCAQALCLEEMLGVSVPKGALFYGRTRHRFGVAFDAGLRRETEEAAQRLRRLIERGVTPRAAREPKCDRCSLLPLCLPHGGGPERSAVKYLTVALEEWS